MSELEKPLKVLIDGIEYYKLTKIQEETIKLLREVRRTLFTESYYDPYNESTRQFAIPLEEKMKKTLKLMGVDH